jgi:predicted protein tyrosine phosphatase
MIRRVFARSYSNMRDLLRASPELLETELFISILNSPGNEPQVQLLPADCPRWVTLRFDDIDTRGVAAMSEEMAAQRVVFNENHADRIIDLVLMADQLEGVQTLHINCAAGACRSGAVASFVRDALRLPYDQFRRDNPQITPNELVERLLRNRWVVRNL